MANSKTSAQVLVDEITGELDFTPWTTTFTFEKSRRMRLDPTLQMARLYSVAPILAASWTVEGDEEEHVKLIKEQLLPLRTHLLSTYLFSEIDFGWKCYEKIFAIDEQGNTVIKEVKPLICDHTRVRYDKTTGAFKGLKTVDLYTGADIFIDAQHSLFINFDEEGLGNYAVAGFQIAEKAYDEWNKCNTAAAKYDEKVAGVYLVVWHPEGKTKLNGIETDNGTIAQTIISTLRASGSVSIPVRVKNTIDQLNGFQSSKVWEVAFLTPGQMQGAFNERATYLDKLKARALGVTERSLFEGTYGTKAEAVTHASAVMLCKMLKHQQVTDYFNLRLVDQILWQNYHTKGTAKLVAQPLTDDRIDLFTRVFESLLSDPAAGLELKDAIDKKQLLESLRVPVEEGAIFDRAARDLPPADEDSQTKTVTETTKTQFSFNGLNLHADHNQEDHGRRGGGGDGGDGGKHKLAKNADDFVDEVVEELENDETNERLNEMALALTGEGEKFVFVDGSGNKASAMSIKESMKEIKILHLGSIQKGAGRDAVSFAASRAIQANKSLRLESTDASIGFYRKLGLKESRPGVFKASPTELKALFKSKNLSLSQRVKGWFMTRDGVRGKGDGPGGGDGGDSRNFGRGAEKIEIGDKELPIFANPSKGQVKGWIKKYGEVRMLFDSNSGDVIIWPSFDATHDQVKEELEALGDPDAEWSSETLGASVEVDKVWRDRGFSLSFYGARKKTPHLKAKIETADQMRKRIQARAAAVSVPIKKKKKLALSKGPHEYATTQINLPADIAKRVRDMSMKIRDEDLAEDGREDEPHVTVLYGLHDLQGVEEAVSGFGKVAVTLGETSIFENDDYDVVKIDVDSEQLRKLNAALSKLPNENKYDEYEPHVTLAYVKKGLGKKYAGMKDVFGAGFAADQIMVRDRDGEGYAVHL